MIKFDSVSHQHGHQILFLDASAAILNGEKIGLVGPNGAGKSTLFRMVMGEEAPDQGQVAIDRGVSVGYFSQDVGEMGGRSVLAETMHGAGPAADIAIEMKTLEAVMADPERADELEKAIERYGDLQARYDQLGGYALEANAREILHGLGFAQEVMDGDVGALSGGWKMRVALARILLMKPDVMLLDEPSNHLDLESLIWLEKFLHESRAALLMTSHDRAFMNRIVSKIIEIDAGELITYSGDYDFYEQQRAIAEAQQEAQYARQQAMLAKEQKFIDRFKARASHAAQVQSRVKRLEKIERVEPPKRRKQLTFEFGEAPRSGDEVCKIDHVSKGYGSKKIYESFDFLMRRRERWCVLGVNGAGKSTLLKLVAGATTPDTGTVGIGAAVKMGYFAQHAMDVLTPEKSVWDVLVDAFPKATIGALKTLAGCFGFSGDDIEKKCRLLSGGEKARVVLARMLFDPPNFLVLDEPTNHLDMGTKEMLVNALKDFGGTMLFVSHDRHFLSALSTRVLELTPQGAHLYPGGYSEYVSASGHEAPGIE